MSLHGSMLPALMTTTEKLRRISSSPAREQHGSILHLFGSSISRIRTHWVLSVVIAAYCGATLIVPTMAPVPISDDWIYARSVQILVQDHVLHVLDVSVATVVFQVLWGSLFASIFGMTFGALRLSTLALVLISAFAVYHLEIQLGIDRGRSALGVAVYLFNPLSLVLSFTFMTDPSFTALFVIASYCYVRGVQRGVDGNQMMITGSVFASLAFLVRQQGALIPIAIACYLLFSGRLRPNFRAIGDLLRVGGIPGATLVAYYVWLQFVNGVPHWQRGYSQYVVDAGWRATTLLIVELVFIGVIYLGLFILPLALASLPAIPQALRSTSWIGRWFVAFWVLVVAVDLGLALPAGMGMPYIPHFLTVSGIGPNDLLMNRTHFFNWHFLVGVTILCGIGSLVLASLLGATSRSVPGPGRTAAGALISLSIWQAAGIIPPSFAFRGGHVDGHIAPSLDRYFLPLLPMAICLLLWAAQHVRLNGQIGWMIVSVFAVFSIMGTRDALVLQQATWHLDQQANQMGILNTQLDGGAAWDGYQLYGFSQVHQSEIQTPPDAKRAWWLYIWAPATDSSYVVAAQPIPSFKVIRRAQYSSWLRRGPSYLYLLQRQPTPHDS